MKDLKFKVRSTGYRGVTKYRLITIEGAKRIADHMVGIKNLKIVEG